MNFIEYYDNKEHDKTILNEGLVYFKTSKKIDRLLKKAHKKLEEFKLRPQTPTNENAIKGAEDKLKQLGDLLPKFKELEDSYKNAKTSSEKDETKNKYKMLFQSNKRLLVDGFTLTTLLIGTSVVTTLGFLVSGLLGTSGNELYQTIANKVRYASYGAMAGSGILGIVQRMRNNESDQEKYYTKQN